MQRIREKLRVDTTMVVMKEYCFGVTLPTVNSTTRRRRSKFRCSRPRKVKTTRPSMDLRRNPFGSPVYLTRYLICPTTVLSLLCETHCLLSIIVLINFSTQSQILLVLPATSSGPGHCHPSTVVAPNFPINDQGFPLGTTLLVRCPRYWK